MEVFAKVGLHWSNYPWQGQKDVTLVSGHQLHIKADNQPDQLPV